MGLTSDYCAASQSFIFEIEMIDQWTDRSYYTKCKEKCNEDVFKIIWITRGELSVNEGSDLPAEGFVISFTKDFLNIGDLETDLTCLSYLSDLFSRSSVIILDDGSSEDINDVVNRMHKEYSNCFALKAAIIKRYFKIFLIYLSRHFEMDLKPVAQTRNVELVKQFMQAIEKNYKDKKMVADYADLLFVTANYLNEVVKKVTGRPAGHHIRNRVVAEAKRMASATNSSMKEIAYKLGFDDSAHFSKFFKSTAGNNFSEFKKQRMTFAVSA